MKRFLFCLFVVNCMFFAGTLLHADLLDCRADGELFYDSQTRLYWYDPGTFAGWTLDKIDAFIHEHSLWNWAGHDQLLDLAGAISAGSCSSLTDVLGAETYTYEVIARLLGCHSRGGGNPVNTDTSGSPLSRGRHDSSNFAIGSYDSFYCWIDFIDPRDTYVAAGIGSDWNLTGMQLYTSLEDDPDSGEDIPVPFISGTIFHGAWLYSESDPLEYTAPVPEPSTIFLIGTGLIGLAGVMRKFGKK